MRYIIAAMLIAVYLQMAFYSVEAEYALRLHAVEQVTAQSNRDILRQRRAIEQAIRRKDSRSKYRRSILRGGVSSRYIT